MIILASASPRRIEMLKNAGFDLVVKPASIIEKLPFDMKPETATMFLALSKAFAVADQLSVEPFDRDCPTENVAIIAADTVVVDGKRIIGKPIDENDAYGILERLRATSHHVITGCCIIKLYPVRKSYCFYEDTEVYFKDYSDEELRAYVKTSEPYDKAGGYAIQGSFQKYIDHIDGDFDNVVGLPLTRVKAYLL